MSLDLKSKILKIENWPNLDILCYDVSPLLSDPKYFKEVIELLAKPYLKESIDKVIGIEAKGFTLASALAYHLEAGLVMIRKKGKLPRETISQSYSYEYASNIIEINTDLILPNEKVIIVDDVLATGGTMSAAIKLIERLNAKIVGVSFIASINFMYGANRLKNQNINYLVKYE